MKISKQVKLILHGLIGIALGCTLGWELFKQDPLGQLPVEVRIAVLVFFGVLTLVWFLQCRTPDKTAIKPKWW